MTAIKSSICYRYSYKGETRKVYAVLENDFVTTRDHNGADLGTYAFTENAEGGLPAQLLGSGALSLARRNGIVALLLKVTSPSNHPEGDPGVIADNDPDVDSELRSLLAEGISK